MTPKEHVKIARQLLEDGKHDEAQTEVLLEIADTLEGLNDRMDRLEESLVFELSTIRGQLDKCLVIPNKERHRAELIEAAVQDQSGAADRSE